MGKSDEQLQALADKLERAGDDPARVDIVRIDHFRGFEAYWAVPADEATARRGVWRKAPGARLFSSLRRALGSEMPIVAEDLGFITDEVKALRDGVGIQTSYPLAQVADWAPRLQSRT